MKGKHVTLEQLQNPELERKAARIIAEIHVIPVPQDMPKKWTLKDGTLGCLKELEANIKNVDKRYEERYAGIMMEEFNR